MQLVFRDVPNMRTVLSSLSLISEPFKDLPFQRYTDHSSKHRIDDKRNNRLENHRQQLRITRIKISRYQQFVYCVYYCTILKLVSA